MSHRTPIPNCLPLLCVLRVPRTASFHTTLTPNFAHLLLTYCKLLLTPIRHPADSMDAIEVDLGELTLKTTNILKQPLPRSQQSLLVEAVSLCFSGE